MRSDESLESGTSHVERVGRGDHVRDQPVTLLRQFQICARLGCSDDSWRRWVKRGDAPAPIDRPGRPRWRVSDIERFEQGRVSEPWRRPSFSSAIRRRSR